MFDDVQPIGRIGTYKSTVSIEEERKQKWKKHFYFLFEIDIQNVLICNAAYLEFKFLII